MPDDDKYRVVAETTIAGDDHVLESLYLGATECFADKGKVVGGFMIVHVHTPDGRAASGIVGVAPGYATPEQKMAFARMAAHEVLAWGRHELARAEPKRKENA